MPETSRILWLAPSVEWPGTPSSSRRSPADGLGVQTAGLPHPLPRRLCAEQWTPRARDTGQAGEGRSALDDVGCCGVCAGRALGVDELGAAFETSLRLRIRDLLGLRLATPVVIASIEDPEVIQKTITHQATSAVERKDFGLPPC